MPHLEYAEEDLDRLYPRLAAPEEEGLNDAEKDAHDALLQKGLEIAREIQAEAVKHGRLRHTGDTNSLECEEEPTTQSERRQPQTQPRPQQQPRTRQQPTDHANNTTTPTTQREAAELSPGCPCGAASCGTSEETTQSEALDSGKMSGKNPATVSTTCRRRSDKIATSIPCQCQCQCFSVGTTRDQLIQDQLACKKVRFGSPGSFSSGSSLPLLCVHPSK